jgi:uncharacterized protein involved in exopolysaccharide biosynthesis
MQDTRLSAAIIESKGEITLRDMLVPLFRHGRLMLISFVVIALASVLVALRVSKTYEAHMEVLVDRERVDPVVTTESTTPIMIPAAAVTEEEVNSEADLLKSQDVLEEVVLENGLANDAKPSLWARLFGKQDQFVDVSLAVKHLGNALKIETPTKTNLIDVSYASSRSSRPRTAYSVHWRLSTSRSTSRSTGRRGRTSSSRDEADKYRSALDGFGRTLGELW